MMKNKVLIAMVVILWMVVLASPTAAQRGRGWGWQKDGRESGYPGGERGAGESRDGRGRPEQRHHAGPVVIPDYQLMDLSLTADQESKINSLREELLKNIRPLQKRMLSKEKDLRTYRLERPDLEELIQSTQKEFLNLREEIMKKKAGYVQAVQKILRPEQNAMLRPSEAGMDERDERREQSRPEGGPGGGPGGPGGSRGTRGNW